MPDKREWVNQIFQVVCVVHDLDRTLSNWKNMVEFDESSIKLGTSDPETLCLYEGQRISCPIRYARFDLGGIDMKLVEPLAKDGHDPYADVLRAKGQGFHHLGIYVQERQSFLDSYEKMGIRPVYEEIQGDTHYALYQLDQEIGMSFVPWDQMIGPCGQRDSHGKTI